ncbi:MFS transporter [Pleomorphomonas sp. NRK KF1]|uniref:MFS transporter n=1 Tax=Pleomorphomonas sp. NRK KF1 TaxID=2943000 RepID=UPI0020441265|nr:MFS transporter [Pleomorphomonas sp. NRK KF1]MCM5554563.1 MFS transporter [Pleomorphomonas sp. NRK KF1]
MADLPPSPATTAAGYSPAVALTMAAIGFMQILDSAIINTSLPTMARSFGVAPIDLSLAVTAYVLAAAAASPLANWLADRFGARNILVAALVAFTLSSIWCALSQTLPELIAARVVQGVGGALLLPVGTAVVMRRAARADFVRATALMVWPALMAPIVGPVLGGFITEHLSWHWNFWLNLPLGACGLLAILRLVPNERNPDPRPFDVVGFALCATSLTTLLAGFQRSAEAGGERIVALTMIGLGTLLGFAAIRHLRRHSAPLLSLGALSHPSLGYAFHPGGLYRILFSAAPFLLPLWFQLGFGLSPASAGLWVLVYFVGNLGIKVITTPLTRRFGFRCVLVGDGVLVALSMVACALVGSLDQPVLVVAILLFAGSVRSIQLTTLTTLAFADVPEVERGNASNLIAMMQQGTQAAGVAVAAFSLSALQAVLGTDAIGLPELQGTFWIMAVLAVVGAIAGLRVPEAFGREVSAATAR